MSTKKSRYFLCIDNRGNEISLQLRRVYRGLPDPEAEAHGMVRVVDESGEDFLFPSALFVSVEIPVAAEKAFARAHS